MDEKTQYQAAIFTNRCLKKQKILRKWARKNGATCYRLYDRDIPEVPLAVDLYEFLPQELFEGGAQSAQNADGTPKTAPEKASDFIRAQNEDESANIPGAAQKRLERTYLKVFLYERPLEFQKTQSEEEEWLFAMCASLAAALGIEQSHIVTKMRRHEKGGSQYAEQKSAQNISGTVYENGSLFFVNLSDYLDTGLFLDMRRMRSIVKSQSEQKRVLNLFCYTGSFSVAAMAGGASFVQSVDLSNTYLEWAKKNFILNGFSETKRFELTRGDVTQFLKTSRALFDIIILDPPTFSNSKKTRTDLNLNADWSVLANLCLKLLSKGGVLYFCTNSKRLAFEKSLLHDSENLTVEEITQKTIDADWEGKKPHRVWEIREN